MPGSDSALRYGLWPF